MTDGMRVDLDELDTLVRVLTTLVGDLPAITTDLRAALAEAGIAFGMDPAADVLRPRFAESGRTAVDALGTAETLMHAHIESVGTAGTRLRTADADVAPMLGTRREGLSL